MPLARLPAALPALYGGAGAVPPTATREAEKGAADLYRAQASGRP